MVTFNCEVCNDTVPKKNTEKHYYKCPNAYYTCIDCNVTFDDGLSYKAHTQCISEDERYQGALYKGKKKKGNAQQKPQQQRQQQSQGAKIEAKQATKEVKVDSKVDSKKAEKANSIGDGAVVRIPSTLLAGKKGNNLYKILKSVKNKDEKKNFLKKLVVDGEGRLIYQAD
ncbi:LAME_0F00738g1_1 [Lachancea meyersii CBS 8951]|uniref:LAME_0F00738g1_1 n=1 Tax=Lachancea meyersii CBS 8951 TaxID=1266667 RepID=A0A1G4JPM4_9SACH|nr:LAME_0F00738g1_1 [Lachancea meyersii CBS 8951]